MIDLQYLVGATVAQVEFGGGVTLSLVTDGGQANLAAGRVRYQPSDAPAVDLDLTLGAEVDQAALPTLQSRTVTSAQADDQSDTLALGFDNGDHLTALPIDAVEGWELAGPGKKFVVAVAGGGVAVWD